MTTRPGRSLRRAIGIQFVAAVITYAITRAAFRLFGFRFSLFERPIDIPRLLLDFGAWVAVFAAVMWLFNMRSGRVSKG